MRFQEAVGGSAVYTDKLADVPPTTAPPTTTAAPEAKVSAAAPTPVIAEPSETAPATDAAPTCTARTTLVSAKVKARTLTLKGATGCASTVRVTIARVGKARSSAAMRAKVTGARWTATKKLARGRYTVSVAGATKRIAVR